LDYLTLFSPHNLALISDWLEETGELYTHVYLPHSGSSGSAYFVRSLKDLKSLVSQQTHPEIVISVFHSLQYSLRGRATQALLERALQQIPDKQWFTIVSLEDAYPSSVSRLASGNSHEELQREFADVLGERVGIGQDPFDIYSADWFRSHPNEVFQVSIFRNQNYYEPYAKDPKSYEWIFDQWLE
jgi:hypothetical protein